MAPSLGFPGLGMSMGIADLRDWLRRAPDGTAVPARVLLDLLGPDESATAPAPAITPAPLEMTWRERLWLVPAETRLGRRELLEALGRSRSWLYTWLDAER